MLRDSPPPLEESSLSRPRTQDNISAAGSYSSFSSFSCDENNKNKKQFRPSTFRSPRRSPFGSSARGPFSTGLRARLRAPRRRWWQLHQQQQQQPRKQQRRQQQQQQHPSQQRLVRPRLPSPRALRPSSSTRRRSLSPAPALMHHRRLPMPWS